MTRADAAIRAYKAIPGAASRTVAPQGALGPNFGQMSPLVHQLANEGGYARTYGPSFLPRQPRTFTDGAYGPFSPILPVAVDDPAPDAEMVDPRRYQFQVGYNLPVGQPGTEGLKLADFGTLKTLSDLYSVARACIQIRKAEIIGLDWDIVPTKDAAKAYHGSPKQMKDFGDRRGKVLKFFKHPDPDYFSFANFLNAMLEEVFVFDALSLCLRPKRGYERGLSRGVMGTDLDCIELINGPTMRPLIGMHGEVPRPPNPAFQQYLYGVPRSDYMTMITERDILEGGLTDAEVNSWTTDQFLYLPMVPRRWTPYGFPPIERALIPVMSGLQKQAFQLDYFKEGTIPAVYISPGDVNMTPNQIRELQDALNAFAGDPAWHHKVIVLPPGSKVDPQKPVDVADQFDEIVMTQVTMAFDVNPMELGLLPKVAAVATPSAARQMAQSSAQIHERISTKPMLKFLQDIFDGILHQVLHQDDMAFRFEGMSQDMETAAKTETLVQQVQSGLISVDEARDELERQPWNLPLTSGPVTFTAAGVLPFGAISGSPGGDQEGAPTPSVVPLQQSGHQNGEPAPTPGHAAATAANTSIRTRSPRVNAPATGSVRAAKYSAQAIESELDALVRHLNKGRRITTWVPRYLPAHAMAVISEDLAKGLTPQQAADIAKTIVLGPDAYEWVTGSPKAEAPWGMLPEFTRDLEEAFAEAIDAIGLLIEEWWAGKLAITRQALAQQAAAIIASFLRPVLRKIWAEGWRAGDQTAGGLYEAWVASHGEDWLSRIAATRTDLLSALIAAAITSGGGAAQVVAGLADMLDVTNRAAMIAVTELGRAASAATADAYRRTGVTHKLWVTAGDAKVCAVCRAAEAEGPVPLDSLFGNGLTGPPAHPNCRCHLEPSKGDSRQTLTKPQANYRPATGEKRCGNCVMFRAPKSCTLVQGKIQPQDVCDRWFGTAAAPMGNASSLGKAESGGPAVPSMADESDLGGTDPSISDSEQIHGDEPAITCDQGHEHHGDGGAGLLIRHRGDDGKIRYLLQQRSMNEDEPGRWGFPGGGLLQGESAYDGAFREATEEMGDIPPYVSVHHHVVDDHGGWVFTTLVCDSDEMFLPDLASAETPDESAGFAWFTKPEIEALPLHPAVAQAWDAVSRTRRNTELGKCVMRRVGLNGQEFWDNPERCQCHEGVWRDQARDNQAAGGGGPEFMPHDAQGIQQGRASESRATGGTAGHNDDAGVVRPHGLSEPSSDDGLDTGGPRGTGQHNVAILQGYQLGHWPQGGHGTRQTTTASPPGTTRRRVRKGDKVAAVYAQLEGNFPDDAIEWVKHCYWEGPQDIPLDEIDWRDHKEWSAWHEQDHVDDFKRKLQAGESIHPPVLIHHPGKKAAIIIDGHHRSMAYQQLGLPVHGWLGEIPEHFIQAALETHSSQHSQGDSKENQ